MKNFLKYFKPHKKLFILDVACAVLVAVCNLFYPFMARKIQMDFVPQGQLNSIIIFLCVLFVIFALKAGLYYIVSFYGHLFGIRVQADMRKDLFAHLQKLPVEYFDENKTGVIMSKIVNDLFEVSELAHHGPEDILISVISVVGALILIFVIHPLLCLIVALVVPVIILTVILSRKNMLNAMTDSRVKTAKINSQVENSVGGIRVSKIFTAETEELKKFNFRNEELKSARRDTMLCVSKFHTLMTFILDMLYLLALVAGVIMFFYDKITAGDLIAFILYVVMMINPISKFQVIFEELQNGISGLRRFNSIMDIKVENERENGVQINEINSLEFKNVFFKYPKTEKYVLNNFSFKCNSGETVAIVGESGGGKTTVTNLILKFYDIDSGNILINGTDINDISLRSLRENIGVVQQDIFLFDGTIKENIGFGKANATLEEIKECAKLANLDEFIESLPNKYDTEIGERGVKLSGGQKQKISIARAFLKNPNFLIFDEATSSLDRFSEIEIQNALENLSNGKTSVIIAHRLSTIKNADKIIVISGNGVAECGTHTELINKKGIYYQLYTKSE